MDRPHRRHEHSLIAFVATAAAGIMFAASSSFAGLFAAQIMMIVARALLAGELDAREPASGERGSLMGTLNASRASARCRTVGAA